MCFDCDDNLAQEVLEEDIFSIDEIEVLYGYQRCADCGKILSFMYYAGDQADYDRSLEKEIARHSATCIPLPPPIVETTTCPNCMKEIQFSYRTDVEGSYEECLNYAVSRFGHQCLAYVYG